MKNAVWLVIGVVVGLAVARRLGRTSQSSELGGTLDARAREFGKTVADSYRARQAELRAALARGDDAINDRR
ncbi:hypothetical protein [Naasia aerilata]|uniref:YtxH domain-containing protein n=1 Tax=Naasia aerilata TaxID=1162966 RepID=A0ABN6XTH3_9MICO|nr:hypothetical protein [Naasia aerilata]BDZ46951.1 hypothetical protein GCM10025866_28600 [Naasia aerilata]